VTALSVPDTSTSILYIDDEENNLIAFKANFRRYYNVFIAGSAIEGKEMLLKNKIKVIVSDQRMPEMTGVEFFESILQDFPDPIRILLTGYSDMDTVVDAINKGQVYKYFMKPFDSYAMKVTIDNAIEVYNLREENKELMRKLIIANEQLDFMLRQKLLS
jgi:DNA-binding NtrC family response regulator